MVPASPFLSFKISVCLKVALIFIFYSFSFGANVTVSLIDYQKILLDAGFLPTNDNKYPLAGIIATIKQTFGASPLLVCKRGAVEELRICFYKDFTVRLDSTFL